MKIPISWLKEYVDIDIETPEIGAILTSIGHMQDGPAVDVADDIVLDLEVRQNRPDVLSMIGVARELAAAIKKELILPQTTSDFGNSKDTTKIVADPKLCYRFHAITIENIEIKESPEWLKKRLETAGIKSINNIVDITNFVAHEWGMPLHAYDAHKVAKRTIHVRNAEVGEELVLFGGKKVKFHPDDLIHADESGPIGFGAIMGGSEKSVQNNTTAIILEGAVYNQACVRRGSIRHSLRSEASTRLEKFLDPRLVDTALARAVSLILEYAGGQIVDNTDFYPTKKEPQTILVHFEEIERLGGVQIARDEIFNILKRLELNPHNASDKSFKVEIPFFRTDLEQEADIIEEVLRMWGYDNIPEKLLDMPVPKRIQSKLYDFEEKTRDILISSGFDEQITEPLTNENDSILMPIQLENSLTSEKSMLRTNLKASLLNSFGERLKYRQERVRIFEIGKMFYEEDGSYYEQSVAGIIMGPDFATYADAKGVCEILSTRLNRKYHAYNFSIEKIETKSGLLYYIHVGLEAMFSEPENNSYRVFTTPPHVILHDFSFTVNQNAKVGEIIDTIYKADPIIFNVTLGEDPRILENKKKSVFIKVSYYKENQTLSEKEVAVVREKILDIIQSDFSQTS